MLESWRSLFYYNYNHSAWFPGLLIAKIMLYGCTNCQMGKSCRLPFLQSDNNISFPFYKIRCDLWGPAPIVSIDKFQFYAIFVDEFTNFTWLFPLKHKFDLFDTFVLFIIMFLVSLMPKYAYFKVMKEGNLQPKHSLIFWQLRVSIINLHALRLQNKMARLRESIEASQN